MARAHGIPPKGERKRLRDKKLLIPIIFLAFLMILLGCSSFFSFSWKTKKEVKNSSKSRVKMVHKENPKEVSGQSYHEKVLTSNEPGTVFYGVQITRLRQKSPEALKKFMKQLKIYGIRVIYFRVFQNPGDSFFKILPRQATEGVYFKSSFAPVVSNLLPVVCRYAHENGIKVYAWMNTLKAGFLHCKGGRHIYRYLPSQGSLKEAKCLSPYDPEILKALLGLFADLAKNPVDGVLVQDDLILHYNEDLSLFARKQFMKKEGLESFSPADLYVLATSETGKVYVKGYTPLFWEWARWKDEMLSGVLAQLKGVVKKSRPSVKFAIDINYEALSSPKDALAWYSRSIREMEKIAHPDCYVVMSYQRQMQEELEKSETVVMKYIRNMIVTGLKLIPDSKRWVFKVQTIDWRTRKPIAQNKIRLAVETIESTAPVDTCLMPYTPDLFKDGLMARLNALVN
jgi:uncharacterized lipoprotein YddW (UPF0748 family)